MSWTETFIRDSLDGVFMRVCVHTGRIYKETVSRDFMPTFEGMTDEPSIHQITGANNGKHKPWTAELDATVLDCRANGMSYREIAAITGRSDSKVRLRYLKLTGEIDA